MVKEALNVNPNKLCHSERSEESAYRYAYSIIDSSFLRMTNEFSPVACVLTGNNAIVCEDTDDG
jgi:hypothetical protein